MKKLKIYRIWQTVNNGWDTYSEAVVISHSVLEARNIVPGHFYRPDEVLGDMFVKTDFWAPSPEDVNVEWIGEANAFFDKPCIVSSSFKAG